MVPKDVLDVQPQAHQGLKTSMRRMLPMRSRWLHMQKVVKASRQHVLCMQVQGSNKAKDMHRCLTSMQHPALQAHDAHRLLEPLLALLHNASDQHRQGVHQREGHQ